MDKLKDFSVDNTTFAELASIMEYNSIAPYDVLSLLVETYDIDIDYADVDYEDIQTETE